MAVVPMVQKAAAKPTESGVEKNELAAKVRAALAGEGGAVGIER
jgi:hypothetical protein